VVKAALTSFIWVDRSRLSTVPSDDCSSHSMLPRVTAMTSATPSAVHADASGQRLRDIFGLSLVREIAGSEVGVEGTLAAGINGSRFQKRPRSADTGAAALRCRNVSPPAASRAILHCSKCIYCRDTITTARRNFGRTRWRWPALPADAQGAAVPASTQTSEMVKNAGRRRRSPHDRK